MEQMHSLLKRQLKRHFGDQFPIPAQWRPFIERVNDAYREFDADREMLEHSLELSSQELIDANSEMRAVFQAIPDLVFRLNHEGTILDIKAGICKRHDAQARRLDRETGAGHPGERRRPAIFGGDQERDREQRPGQRRVFSGAAWPGIPLRGPPGTAAGKTDRRHHPQYHRAQTVAAPDGVCRRTVRGIHSDHGSGFGVAGAADRVRQPRIHQDDGLHRGRSHRTDTAHPAGAEIRPRVIAPPARDA